MTLLNISIARDRALVATDSLGYSWTGGVQYRHDGMPVHTQKIHRLGNYVLTGRGRSALFDYLLPRLVSHQDVGAAVARMPELLRGAIAEVPTLAPQYRGDYPFDEVWIVGWSAQHGQMVGVLWSSDCGFQGEVDDGYLQLPTGAGQINYSFSPDEPPGPENETPLERMMRTGPLYGSLLDDHRATLDFARAQVEHARRRVASGQESIAPYGGRLIVAKLDQHSVSVQDLGDLGLPARAPRGATSESVSQQIANGAATGVWTTQVSSASVTGLSGVPNNYTRFTQVASITATPSPTDAIGIDVLLTVSFQWDQTAGANADMGQVLIGDSAAYDGWQIGPLAPGIQAASTTMSGSYATTRQLSRTGNAPCTFGVWGQKTQPGTTLTFRNIEFRVEAIKR